MKFVEELPGPGYRNAKVYDWETIVADLMNNPGEWGTIERMDEKPLTKQVAQSVAGHVKMGRINGFEKGEFEAASRQNVVFARYIGKDGQYA